MRHRCITFYHATEKHIIRRYHRMRRQLLLDDLQLPEVLALRAIQVQEIIGPFQRFQKLCRIAQMAVNALREAGRSHDLLRAGMARRIDLERIDLCERETLCQKQRGVADGCPDLKDTLRRSLLGGRKEERALRASDDGDLVTAGFDL